MSFLGQDEQIREYQFRFRYLYIALSFAFFILLSRLWYLQILRGTEYRLHSEENHIKKVKIPSPRGMIFDRNKKLLVDNRPAFDLELTPQELYASTEWKQNLNRLSKIIDMSVEDILETLKEAKGQAYFLPIRIKQDLSDTEVAVLEAHKLDLPGVNIQMYIRRTHVNGDLAAHLIGYIGEVNQAELPKLNKKLPVGSPPYKMGDFTGKSGLESRWESVLRGLDGEEYMEVDAMGRRKKHGTSITGQLLPKQSVPGRNLVLTIDQDLQNVALNLFEKMYGDKKIGAVIAIDPKSGEILAAMSQPSFDPTSFSRGVSPEVWNDLLRNKYHPLRDKTIQDHYSPGSTFKVITAIAALEEKAIDDKTIVNCPGFYKLGNRSYRCHSKNGHGTVNVYKALTQSCDVFFYRVGQKIGIDTIARYARMFGLGKTTGVNLAHEEAGLMPTEEWKKRRFGQEWVAGETLSCAIGQSYVLTTPIQLANSFAILANGGFIHRPYIIKYIESPDGRVLKEFGSERVGQANISKATIDIVKKGLWGVINGPGGTARGQRIPGMEVIGKTGTTQVIKMSDQKVVQKCESMPFDVRDNGLFVAYAPPEDPVISVAVIAEHSCHGGSGAGPIAMAIIKTYLQKKLPEKYSDEAIRQRLQVLAKAKKDQPPGTGSEASAAVVKPDAGGTADE